MVVLSSCGTLNYVPDEGWPDQSDSKFYEDWFGKQLAAASEPVLANKQDLGPYANRFRLMVLPSFSHTSVYRIDETDTGAMRLTYTLLDGAGGYEPGRIAVKVQRYLTPGETGAFLAVLNEARLPSAQPEADLRVKVDENGDEFITICGDGTQIVVERLSPLQRSFITRHECELERFPEINDLYTFVSALNVSN